MIKNPNILFFRLCNPRRYHIFIAYNTDNKDENVGNNANSPMNSYYCPRQSRARSLGTYAHAASVLWYLGFALHQENIKYRDVSLLHNALDAADREFPDNPRDVETHIVDGWVL